MRHCYLSVLAIGILCTVDAQDQCLESAPAIPSCGTSCIVSAASGAGCQSTEFRCQCSNAAGPVGCEGTDIGCLCQKQEAIQNGATECEASANAIPSCGQQCIIDAAFDVGCSSLDYECSCSESDTITQSSQQCVIDACGTDQALRVQSASQALCTCIRNGNELKKKRGIPLTRHGEKMLDNKRSNSLSVQKLGAIEERSAPRKLNDVRPLKKRAPIGEIELPKLQWPKLVMRQEPGQPDECVAPQITATRTASSTLPGTSRAAGHRIRTSNTMLETIVSSLLAFLLAL